MRRMTFAWRRGIAGAALVFWTGAAPYAHAAGTLFDAAGASGWSYVTQSGGSETGITPSVDGAEVTLAPGAGATDIARFTVTEAGWYSAVAEFRALNAGDARTFIFVNGENCAAGRCSTAVKACSSFVYRNQVTPRELAAGDTIEFRVTGTSGGMTDAVALRAVVRKETPGTFFDLGAALSKSVTSGFANPVAGGSGDTWSFLYRWNEGRLYKAPTKNTRDDGIDKDMGAGYALHWWDDGKYQQLYVNHSGDSVINNMPEDDSLRKGEINVHPQYCRAAGGAAQGVQLLARFYAPRGGWYSGCLALRSTCNWMPDYGDGAYGHILLGRGTEIAKIHYSYKNGLHSNMVEFGPVYVAGGEPLDFYVEPGPNGNNQSDRGVGSLVYRFEGDGEMNGKVGYDCAAALADNIAASSTHKPNANPVTLADGAAWTYGYSASRTGNFTLFNTSDHPMIAGDSLAAPVGFSNGGPYNQILIHTNDTFLLSMQGSDSKNDPNYPKYPVIIPYTKGTLDVHPGRDADTIARFTPKRDGRYTVRMWMHAYAKAEDSKVFYYAYVNGQCLGRIQDTQIRYDNPGIYASYDIPTLVFRDLDLREGDDVRLVVNRGDSNGSDRSGGGFAVIREGDIPEGAAAEVVNFAFNTPGDSGKISAFTAAGAFGTPGGTETWNTYASAPDKFVAAVAADGTTKHKMTFAFDGVAPGTATKNDSAYALMNGSFATTPDVPHAFTIGNLVPGEAYSLCFYSAQGKATRGSAVFTVGGETRAVNGVEQTATVNNNTFVATAYDGNCRFDVQSNCSVRFDDVTADAQGEIHGTFACAPDKAQAAFNGFSIRGAAYRKYYGPGTVLVVR